MEKKKIPQTQLSDHLPEEIKEEILWRVDVKSLLRCRCVSKSYRSLIDSKRFIKLHLLRSTTLLARHRVLFLSDTRTPEPKVSGCSLLSFIDSSSHDRAASELNSAEANLLSLIDPSELNSCFESSSFKAASELNFPTNILPYDAIYFVGCCNGLVCILLERNKEIGSRFMLWNPSTRISKEVPHIDKNKMFNFRCYGFGWDESSDDYKIVAIVQVEGQTQTTKIYSLKSDSLKQNDGWVGLSRSWSIWDSVGMFTTGKLQWECWDRTERHYELVAFDLKREVFQKVEQPFSFNDNYSLLLGTFGECLALQCKYDDYIEIWVMKEFGVKESWEKVMVLEDGGICPSVAASYNGWIGKGKGKGKGKGGEIIFMNIDYYMTYLAYNEKKKCLYYTTSFKDFNTKFETEIYSKIYIESLVSPLE